MTDATAEPEAQAFQTGPGRVVRKGFGRCRKAVEGGVRAAAGRSEGCI